MDCCIYSNDFIPQLNIIDKTIIILATLETTKYVFFNFQRELDQFDKETEAQLKEADNYVQPSLEVKHAHERLRLRERQLQELAGTMTDLLTNEVNNISVADTFHAQAYSQLDKTPCYPALSLRYVVGYTILNSGKFRLQNNLNCFTFSGIEKVL